MSYSKSHEHHRGRQLQRLTLLAQHRTAWTREQLFADRFWDLTWPEETNFRRSSILPTLDPLLKKALHSVKNGPGIARIRGLPVDYWSMSDYKRILSEVAKVFGPQIPMDARGSLVHRVEVTKSDAGLGVVRGYQTTDALTYHNDACDFIVFLCIRASSNGGYRRLASPAALASRLASQHATLALELYRPIRYVQYFNANRNCMPSSLPTICFDLDEPIFVVKPGYVRWSEALDYAPFESAVHRTCFQKFLALAHSPEFRASWKVRSGDLEIYDNFRVLHARNSFSDIPGKDGRLLLRTWNCDKDAGSLPLAFGEAEDYRALQACRNENAIGRIG